MNKNGIIHFVGFITKLDHSIFLEQWTNYARQLTTVPHSVILQEKTGGQGKFNYLSRHAFNKEDFSFSFMKGRDSENFSEQKAKVVMMGGYTAVGPSLPYKKTGDKIIMCFNQDRVDIEYYNNLLSASCVNQYERFYENCMYSHILEFVTTKTMAETLPYELVKSKECLEISLFRNCQVSAPVY